MRGHFVKIFLRRRGRDAGYPAPHTQDVRFSRIRFLGCTRFRARHTTRLDCYSPQGSLHMFPRSCCVRHVFPLQAPYSRQVLPLVRGFPTLRVLCLIRLPFNQGPSTSALVPLPVFAANLGLRIVLFPGFPFVPQYRHPIFEPRNRMGLPSSCVHLFIHATA